MYELSRVLWGAAGFMFGLVFWFWVCTVIADKYFNDKD